MNLKEPNNQESIESKDSNMSGMKMMMIACCAIPLAINFFTGGGLGLWLGRSNQ
ncbi:hypothetical protein HCU40_18900 (plasmid) [Pseudanabaena biceps]|nr:hypothetical protein [Pseudanabaena biceps]